MTSSPAAAIVSSFDALLKRHADLIHSIIRSCIAVRDREDAYQQIVAGLWPAYCARYDEEQAALAAGQESPHHWRAYIRRTCLNVAIDFARSYLENRSRDVSLDRPLPPSHYPSDGEEPVPFTLADLVADLSAVSPGDYAITADLGQLLDRTLRAMPEEERTAAIAHLLDEADQDESDRRGYSRSTARRRRVAATARLQHAFIAAGHFPSEVLK